MVKSKNAMKRLILQRFRYGIDFLMHNAGLISSIKQLQQVNHIKCTSDIKNILKPFQNKFIIHASVLLFLPFINLEEWPSGLWRTPGKRVYGNVSRVRIPSLLQYKRALHYFC